jgi:hypothetical protein
MTNRDDDERRLWVDNDEGLWNWWRSSGLRKGRFIRENRAELDRLIDAVLNKKPDDNWQRLVTRPTKREVAALRRWAQGDRR